MNFWESFYRGLKELAGTPIGVLYLTMLTMIIIYTLKGIKILIIDQQIIHCVKQLVFLTYHIWVKSL